MRNPRLSSTLPSGIFGNERGRLGAPASVPARSSSVLYVRGAPGRALEPPAAAARPPRPNTFDASNRAACSASRSSVRSSTPAPTRSTSASAVSTTTSVRRRRRVRTPPVAERLDSCSPSARLGHAADSACATPNAMAASVDASAVNASTQTSTCALSMRWNLHAVHEQALQQRLVAQPALSRPAAPPGGGVYQAFSEQLTNESRLARAQRSRTPARAGATCRARTSGWRRRCTR